MAPMYRQQPHRPTAAPTGPTNQTTGQGAPAVGKYAVDVSSIERLALPVLRLPAPPAPLPLLVVVDEVGLGVYQLEMEVADRVSRATARRLTLRAPGQGHTAWRSSALWPLVARQARDIGTTLSAPPRPIPSLGAGGEDGAVLPGLLPRRVGPAGRGAPGVWQRAHAANRPHHR